MLFLRERLKHCKETTNFAARIPIQRGKKREEINNSFCVFATKRNKPTGIWKKNVVDRSLETKLGHWVNGYFLCSFFFLSAYPLYSDLRKVKGIQLMMSRRIIRLQIILCTNIYKYMGKKLPISFYNQA